MEVEMIRVVVVAALLFCAALTSGAPMPTVRQLDTNSVPNSSKTESKLPTTRRDLKQKFWRPGVGIRGDAESTSPQSSPSKPPLSFRGEALALHNDARRKTEPPAANMPRLSWSSKLAFLAELWSRRCAVDYGLSLSPTPITYNGRILQNVWSGEQPRDGALAGAVSSWLAEGREFQHGTGACYRADGCKHYLTMTSASVLEVGCGFSECHGDIIAVCYYGTQSSLWELDYPLPHYTAGQPCSQCGPEDWCDDGLCRSQVQHWRIDPADTKCQCDKPEATSSSSSSEVSESAHGALISHGSSVILYRHRRQAAGNDSTSSPGNYGNIDIPLWIFVGLLAFVVFLGLIVGIISMLVCICKESCKSCCNRCGACWCCKRRPRGRGRSCKLTGKWCCKKSNKVGNSRDIRAEDSHDGPSAPPLEEPLPNRIEYVDGATCTELLVTSEQSTNTEALEFIDAEVQVTPENCDTNVPVEPENCDTAIQVEPENCDTAIQVEPENCDTEVQVEPETKDVGVQVDRTGPSPPQPPSSPPEDPGECLTKGCQICPNQTRDQREVHAEKIEVVRKINQANRDPSLKPGDRIF